VSGDGRTPETLAMLTIEPPTAAKCGRAAWATVSGASKLSWTIRSENRGLAVAALAWGEPPALLTTRSIRPCRAASVSIHAATASGSRMSQAVKPASRPPDAGLASGAARPQVSTA